MLEESAQVRRKYEMNLFDSLPPPVRKVLSESPVGIKTSIAIFNMGGFREIELLGVDHFAVLLEKYLKRTQKQINIRKGY